MSKDRQEDGLTQLEAGLHDALRPVELPEGFAARVRQRLDEAPERPRTGGVSAQPAASVRATLGISGARLWRDMIAAVLVLAVLLTGWGTWHTRRERAEAAHAKAQFELAMQVTARSLSKVKRDLERRSAKGEVQ